MNGIDTIIKCIEEKTQDPVKIRMYFKLIVEKMEMKEKKKMPKYWSFDDIDDDSKSAV